MLIVICYMLYYYSMEFMQIKNILYIYRDCDDTNVVFPECTADERKKLADRNLCGAIKYSKEFTTCARKFKEVSLEYYG